MKTLKYTLILILLSSVSLVSCNETEESLKTGDLAFVLSCDGEFSSAISSATSSSSHRDYTHVGIVERREDGLYVIDASAKDGVSRNKIESFLVMNRNVDFYRLDEDFDPKDVILRAESFLAEPYDYSFLPDNGMMYCSELVYECFLRKDGSHIFLSKPMNFYSPDGTLADFWQSLFDSLGMEVPQDIPGTNPNDMSQSKNLRLIKEVRD